MATAQDLINFALGEVGYCRWDDPLPGTKYGRWYADLVGDPYFGMSGVPFCAMGGSYVAYNVGVSSPVTPSAVTFDDRDDLQGRYVGPYDLIPGDFISFDWDGDWKGDHFGICYIRHEPGVYETIEFNTGDGEVKIQTRYASQICCGCRPWYDEAPAPEKDGISVDGAGGPETIGALQEAFGSKPDGVISSQNAEDAKWRRSVWSIEHDEDCEGSLVVTRLQKFLIGLGYSCGAAGADGLWGYYTTEALQQFLKDKGYYDGEIDHDFGPHSMKALQAAINDSVFG